MKQKRKAKEQDIAPVKGNNPEKRVNTNFSHRVKTLVRTILFNDEIEQKEEEQDVAPVPDDKPKKVTIRGFINNYLKVWVKEFFVDIIGIKGIIFFVLGVVLAFFFYDIMGIIYIQGDFRESISLSSKEVQSINQSRFRIRLDDLNSSISRVQITVFDEENTSVKYLFTELGAGKKFDINGYEYNIALIEFSDNTAKFEIVELEKWPLLQRVRERYKRDFTYLWSVVKKLLPFLSKNP